MEKIVLTELQAFTKRLVRLAIHKAGGNRAAAEWTGFQGSELSLFANDDANKHISLWRAMTLDEAAGDVMLKAWARRRGFEVITHEQHLELAQSVSKIVGRLAHAGADLESAALDAVADGKTSNNEIKQTEVCAGALIGAAEDTVQAVAKLRAV
jgi:hypothetical protein